MGREREHYRDNLAYLAEKYPLVLQKKQAAEILGCSIEYLNKLICKKAIKEVCGKIPLGTIANYLSM